VILESFHFPGINVEKKKTKAAMKAGLAGVKKMLAFFPQSIIYSFSMTEIPLSFA